MSSINTQTARDRQVPSKLSASTSLAILLTGLAIFGITFSAYMGTVGILISCSLLVATIATVLLVDRIASERGRRDRP